MRRRLLLDVSESLIVTVCTVVALVACWLLYRVVGVPVRQAVFEKTHSFDAKHLPPPFVIQDDDVAFRGSSRVRGGQGAAPKCEGPVTKYVDAYHVTAGTWQTHASRAPDAQMCRRKCDADPQCSGYTYESKGRKCNIVPTGAQKRDATGTTHLRGSVTDWIDCVERE